MEPYDAFDAIDPFTAATRAFDCLKGALAGPESAALSHHELEDLVGLQGRELLRLLFQGHLDLREMREREQMRQTKTQGWSVVRTDTSARTMRWDIPACWPVCSARSP